MLRRSRQATFRGVTLGGSRGAREVASRRRSAYLCVIGHFSLSDSCKALPCTQLIAGETESRVRTSRRQHQGISGGRVPDLCREQGGGTANCESCPRVRVPFARKELWAIFFLCCFQAAVGVCPRGARGRSGCLGAQQGTPRLLVRALKLSPAVPGLQPPTANCRSFSLERAGESQERRARGLGKSPAETWTAAQAQANPARSWSWRPTHPARTAGRGASRPR